MKYSSEAMVRTSGEPVFSTLVRKLERAIVTGRYRRGEVMPSDDELAEQHKVSRYAARETYNELVRRGLVERVKRRGTVVTYDPSNPRVRKVGLILIADVPAFFLFEQGVEQILGEHGSGLRVAYHYGLEERNTAALNDMLSHEVDGLIVAPPPHSGFDRYRQLIDEGIPVVVAGTVCPFVHSVYPNDHKAGLLMGDHFGAQGFKNPALVTDWAPYARERMFGFREGLTRHGISLNEENAIALRYATESGEAYPDLGRREVEQFLQLSPRPDSILVVNDRAAISVYYWLLRHGLRIPEDVAVAGIDYLGPRFHPFQLTTVDIGLEETGRRCASLLLEQIGGGNGKPTHHQIEPKLVVSASTQR